MESNKIKALKSKLLDLRVQQKMGGLTAQQIIDNNRQIKLVRASIADTAREEKISSKGR